MAKLFFYSSLFLNLIFSASLLADNSAPWGSASLTPTEYKPQKVVYDVHVKTVAQVESVLDRASHLRNL